MTGLILAQGADERNPDIREPDRTQLEQWLSLLPKPIELRIPESKKNVISGYYDDVAKLIEDLDFLAGNQATFGKIPAIYTTINQPYVSLLARSYNKFELYAKHTTKDKEIVRRIWLPLDCDPVRPSGISATDEEHQAAVDFVCGIRDYLGSKCGWPDPLIAGSGNGSYGLYRIDLPNTPEVTQAIKALLEALANKFHNEVVKVDTGVHNAARICKTFGTWVQKGDEVNDRRHRLARLLEVPEELVVITLKQIQDATVQLTGNSQHRTLVPEQPSSIGASVSASDDPMERSVAFVDDFLLKHEIAVDKDWQPYNDGQRLRIECCPFCGESDKSAVIIVRPEGAIAYKCQHNRCSGENERKWQDFRQHFDPSCYEESEHSDASEYIAATLRKIRASGDHDDVVVIEHEKEPERRVGAGARGSKGKKSVSTLVTEIALQKSQLWTDGTSGWATVKMSDHVETHMVGSTTFRRFLQSQYLARWGKAPSRNGLDEALETVEALAVCHGPKHDTFVRVAYQDGRILIDLGDPHWRCVEITADGWKVIPHPVKFVRHENFGELPAPRGEGDINILRHFLNVEDEDFLLVVGWLLDALKGDGPYHVCVLNGEQGSCKSTTLQLLRRMIDPVAMPESDKAREPRDERDLAIEAAHSHCVSFDNLSKLPQWLSDAFCRLATGGAFKTRKLYKDDDLKVFSFKRPLILNGIENFVIAGDLASRSLVLNLPTMPDSKRIDEGDFWTDFHSAQPQMLAALYSALSHGLRTPLKLEKKPRMADSYTWVARCIGHFGWTLEEWSAAYCRNEDEAVDVALESSKLGMLMTELAMDVDGEAKYGASELYEQLRTKCISNHMDWMRFFPSCPKTMTDGLKRIAPMLRRRGVVWDMQRSNGLRWHTIRRTTPKVAQTVFPIAGDDSAAPVPHESLQCRTDLGRAALQKPFISKGLAPTVPQVPHESQIFPRSISSSLEKEEELINGSTSVEKHGNHATLAALSPRLGTWSSTPESRLAYTKRRLDAIIPLRYHNGVIVNWEEAREADDRFMAQVEKHELPTD